MVLKLLPKLPASGGVFGCYRWLRKRLVLLDHWLSTLR